MAAKNVELVGFTATPVEVAIIDEMRKRNYKMNKSEVIRLLINEGAKNLLGTGKKEPKTSN